jgi:septal ring factor EnvC (AmiA/AmiB activator)
MLIPITDVSKEFKKDVRTIQMWCAKEGISKIGNEYQITSEVVERWKLTRTGMKSKPKPKPISNHETKTKQVENSPKFRTLKISLLSILFTALVGFLINYNAINSQQATTIQEQKQTIQEQKQTIQVQQTTIQEKDDQLDAKQSTIEGLKRQHSIDSTLINTPIYKRKPAY